MKKKIIIVSFTFFILLMSNIFAASNVDVSGKIFNQYRWTNATGMWYYDGNFGPSTAPYAGRDNERFGNFVRTEVGFEINANVTKYAKIYTRILTVFDANDPGADNDGNANASAWQTFYDSNTGWFQLRGFRIDLNPDIKYVNLVSLGTPMGLPFSKWLLSDRRYIDRDNAKGIVIKGNITDNVKWNIARMWNPNWMGSGWGSDNNFRAEDGTWGLNLNSQVNEKLSMALDASWFTNTEFDPKDGDFIGAVDPDSLDGHYDVKDIYSAYGLAFTTKYDLSDNISMDLTAIMTKQDMDKAYDTNDDNIVDTYQGWWPNPKYKNVSSFSGIFTIKTTDPFGIGLSPNFQFFYLDHNYVSYWGSRREDDMLMINGGIDGTKNTYGRMMSLDAFFNDGGQSAVRAEMTDNAFLRLGEALYESAVGYWGTTFDLKYDASNFGIKGQLNIIGATDNTGGKVDKEDPNYEGNGTYYMPARDFMGLVGDFGFNTKAFGMDLGLLAKFGNWSDKKSDKDNVYDNIATKAYMFQMLVGKQLTKSLAMEIKPTIRNATFVTETANGDNEVSNQAFVLLHKWTYNFGGFDFWLRGEHNWTTHKVELAQGTNPDDHKLSYHALHAAFEVKF